jgi:type IV pilus assembly protein PilZ
MADRETDERRSIARAPIELRVEYKRFNAFLADYTKNISRGGTFIATSKPLPVGTDFLFALAVPSRALPLRLRGTVMWTIEEGAATKANPAGMGIEFQYEEANERELMARIVTDLVRAELGDHVAEKLGP